MKKETFQKLLIISVAIFVVLNLALSQLELSGQLLSTLTAVKYVLLATVVVTSLLYAKMEDPKLFAKVLKLYGLLVILYAIFKIRGLV
ncbi:MAG: hypothetical protein Q4D95_01280 [Peptoniphilus sp.]|nr:hypothetical protein [Peptoniphilus sp.]